MVQRPPAHIREGRHLKQIALHVPAHLVEGYHVVERVVERAQIGVHLGLHVSGQKAETLARLDGRACQHDLPNGTRFECRDGHGDGKIGLSGPGRPDTEHQVVLLDRPDVVGLTAGPRPDRTSRCEHINPNLADGAFGALRLGDGALDVGGREFPGGPD